MEVYTGLRGIGKIHTRTVFLLVLNTKKGEWTYGKNKSQEEVWKIFPYREFSARNTLAHIH